MNKMRITTKTLKTIKKRSNRNSGAKEYSKWVEKLSRGV